ncbi:MAG: hypothetical protein RLY57_396, partial [Candidatus Parcubacteria bacterium]
MKNLHIPNLEQFNTKLQQIRDAGISKLHFISDFDRTLTGKTKEGKATTTSWAIFTSELGQEYTIARQVLFDQYFPIENDPTLDPAYRFEQMSEWWKKHLDLLIDLHVNQKMIERIIKNEQIELREGVPYLFDFASKNNIPFLIFSAGIGDAILTHLKMKKLKTDNIHILSNFFTFNENGNITGFQKETIHTLNKNEVQLKNEPYLNQILERPNCILLGDAINDAQMANGIPHAVV